MKKLIVLLVLAISGLSLCAQNYVLEPIYQDGNIDLFGTFYVADEGQKIWSLSSAGPIMIDNGQLNYINNPIGHGGQLAGLEKQNGDHCVVFGTNNYSFSWNNETMEYDHFSNQVDFLTRLFVYEEGMIYLCGGNDFYNEQVIYLWDGEENFEKIFSCPDDQGFHPYDMYVKNENHITILSSNSSDKLFRFDGDTVSELCSLDPFLIGSDRAKSVNSADGENFFIMTTFGKVLLWDDNTSQLSLFYEPEDGRNSRIFVKSSDELFVFGTDIVLIDIQKGTETKLLEGLGSVTFAYYDEENDQMYFSSAERSGLSAGIYRLTTSTSAGEAPSPEKISIHQKGSDVYRVDNPSFLKASLSVYNINGVKIKGVEINEAQTEIDFSVLNSGVYILVIETPDGLISRKILKR